MPAAMVPETGTGRSFSTVPMEVSQGRPKLTKPNNAREHPPIPPHLGIRPCRQHLSHAGQACEGPVVESERPEKGQKKLTNPRIKDT